ncbi:MAG: hypothetical protein IPL89_06245 [Acidobacteria bacterium]|nr:hypothetical protein [Acidobacteriota bacterium]
MKNRTALVAVVAAILAAPAGRASTPCDALPATNKVIVSPQRIGDALCNACLGPPVPGKRDPLGNGLDYNDGAKHWECEMMVGNRGNGQCKKQTTCLPGGDRFDDNGVFRCRYPAVVATAPNTPANPREACERGLKISITRVKNLDGLALTNNVVHKSAYPMKLLLEGDGVANGVSASIGGGISVSVGDAAQRLGASPSGTCLPPNCQVVALDNLANAPTGRQKLTLFTPHQFASASVDLYVDVVPPMAVAGDPECLSPVQTGHLRIALDSPSAGPRQSIAGRVFVTSPLPTPPPGQQMTLTVHGSLVGVTPSSFNVLPSASSPSGQGPYVFTFSNPNPPAQPLPPNFRGSIVNAPVAQERRCVWARLGGAGLPEIVAAVVTFTP